MTKITSIKHPEKPKLNAVQRFLWWKKVYFGTYSIIITILILPLFAYYRGNISLGIKLSTIFYLTLIILVKIANYITKNKDKKFLESQGYATEKNSKWWTIPLKMLFFCLQIYIIYIMFVIWRMTNV